METSLGVGGASMHGNGVGCGLIGMGEDSRGPGLLLLEESNSRSEWSREGSGGGVIVNFEPLQGGCGRKDECSRGIVGGGVGRLVGLDESSILCADDLFGNSIGDLFTTTRDAHPTDVEHSQAAHNHANSCADSETFSGGERAAARHPFHAAASVATSVVAANRDVHISAISQQSLPTPAQDLQTGHEPKLSGAAVLSSSVATCAGSLQPQGDVGTGSAAGSSKGPITAAPLQPPSSQLALEQSGDSRALDLSSGIVKAGAPPSKAGTLQLKGGTPAKSQSGDARTTSSTWTGEENNIFFTGLRRHGRSFDKIYDDLKGSKTKEQVRCYYYRVVKKLSQVIQPTGTCIEKNRHIVIKDVIEAILAWWELMKQGVESERGNPTSLKIFKGSTNLDSQDRMRLAKMVQGLAPDAPQLSTPAHPSSSSQAGGTGQPLTVQGGMLRGVAPPPAASAQRVVGGQDTTPQTPTHQGVGQTPLREDRVRDERPVTLHSPSTLSMGSGVNSPSDASPSATFTVNSAFSLPADMPKERFTLRLTPLTTKLSEEISCCGYNPQLELTFKASKAISSIAQHLSDKWTMCLRKRRNNSSIQGFRIFTVDFPHGSPGWGVEDTCLLTKEIYESLGRPESFRLMYDLAAPHNTAPHSLPAAPTAATPVKPKGQAESKAMSLASSTSLASLASGPERSRFKGTMSPRLTDGPAKVMSPPVGVASPPPPNVEGSRDVSLELSCGGGSNSSLDNFVPFQGYRLASPKDAVAGQQGTPGQTAGVPPLEEAYPSADTCGPEEDSRVDLNCYEEVGPADFGRAESSAGAGGVAAPLWTNGGTFDAASGNTMDTFVDGGGLMDTTASRDATASIGVFWGAWPAAGSEGTVHPTCDSPQLDEACESLGGFNASPFGHFGGVGEKRAGIGALPGSSATKFLKLLPNFSS